VRYNIRNSSVVVVGCVEPFFLAKITTYEYSRTVKTKTMSVAWFATLTAEEKVILLESKDSKNTKDATKFAVSTFSNN